MNIKNLFGLQNIGFKKDSATLNKFDIPLAYYLRKTVLSIKSGVQV